MSLERLLKHLQRQQVTAVLKELEVEEQVRLEGKGAGARARLHLIPAIA